MLLDRKSLLAKQDLQVTKVDLGNGDFVYVRMMSGRERDRFEQSLIREETHGNKVEYKRSLEDFRAKLAIVTICDEQGNLILHNSKDDLERLSTGMSAARLELIVNAAQKLNNFSPEDVEGLVKNSKAAQSGSSTSDSQKS